MADKVLREHNFNLCPAEFGGESLYLKTKFIDNGDKGADGFFINQTLTLQSYGNCASFSLYSINFTPEILRKLANELEVEINKVKVQKEMGENV